MSDKPPDPDALERLSARLSEVERRAAAARKSGPPPTPIGIAFRFTAEMVSALLVGGGLGWLLDHFIPAIRPWGIVVMFVLGAAAGIRNVLRAAAELNAEMSAKDKER